MQQNVYQWVNSLNISNKIKKFYFDNVKLNNDETVIGLKKNYRPK